MSFALFKHQAARTLCTTIQLVTMKHYIVLFNKGIWRDCQASISLYKLILSYISQRTEKS